MAGRGFCVKVQLDLHAVTCPGVWLCPNGKVALRINSLGSTVESHRVSPIFPLLLHDKFIFKKVFTRVSALTDLQKSLEQEWLHAELIQWITSCNRGIILATFETNLSDLLYPVPNYKGLLAGVDVDLLMEPTKYFPGIIVPKIEISTKTTIEEVLGICEASLNGAYIVNPKTINSKHTSCFHRKRPAKGIIRQRTVCHSQGKSRNQVTRPISTSCRRQVNNAENWDQSEEVQLKKCYHPKKTSHRYGSHVKDKEQCWPTVCNNMHMFDSCAVCSKYRCRFSGQCEDTNVEKNAENKHKENLLKNIESLRYDKDLNDDYHCLCRLDSPDFHEPARSVLRSRSQEAINKSYHTEQNCGTKDVSECTPWCTGNESQTKQGFYKNLEKFYKRMYKQAKQRAQEANV